MTTCSNCGASIPGASSLCPTCGRPRPTQEAEAGQSGAPHVGRGHVTDAAAGFPLFPVSVQKFVVMSVCSFGLYEYYWAYKNWAQIRATRGGTISPFWRAVFAPLWNFVLFQDIHGRVTQVGMAAAWSPMALALCFFVLQATAQLPNDWWMISTATFLPYIPVLRAIEGYREQEGLDPNSSYSFANALVIILGGAILVLAFVATFAPPPE